MWKELRILLLGEPKVGKTSLILSLVSEEFAEEVPLRAEEITIPADVTPEKVPTHIVDFSSAEQNDLQLYQELSRANVVCLVYDLSDSDTLVEVQNTWLPVIRENSLHPMPIILVGNKSDLVGDSQMDDILPIMNEYPEVETCIECSAKTLKNISEMFYFAQKAVLHPTAPLFCTQTGMLKNDCRIALARIFCLCDLDKDGMLCDDELSNFQKICFNTPLASQSLQDVKTVVCKSCPEGVRDGKLTVEGFLYLHSLFIQRGRHETTWAVLRKFGYSDNLELTDQYLYPPIQEPPPDSACQLTNDTYKFLEIVFRTHDRDHDGFLNQEEIGSLFSVFPYDPWGPDVLSTVHTNSQGWISLRGFFSQWTLTAYLDLPRTMEYLAYLGYSTLTGRQSQAEAIEYIALQPHSGKRKYIHAMQRKIYTCKVIGPHGVGKTSFLQSLLERKGVAGGSEFAINTVSVQSHLKYLLLHEVDSTELLESGEGALTCDAMCLLYDVSDAESFQECVNLYKQYVANTNIPCLVIAAKSDLPAAKQHCAVQPIDFCRSQGIPPPLKFSLHTKECSQTTFQTVASFAAHKKGLSSYDKFSFGTWFKIGLFTAILGVIGFTIYKNTSHRSQSLTFTRAKF
ncbi:mitochondrial Rho GTPase 1-like [Styela clava]|uniref:mitochondrial Rho GTPase 1-like n=1 Tax=Styela clava TaxID=7725 RepID=UPI00193A5DAC|nr:mitochondrial Rho GTPase 1-like [Styela clava]